MPAVLEENYTNRVVAMTGIIDTFIKDISGRTIVETSEVLDFCLDLRQALNRQEEDS